MSARRAPSAFLMPISRVRSVTDTSMTFITPMPATTSEMPAMPARSRVIVPSISLPVRSISSCDTTENCPAGTLALPARYDSMARLASSMPSSPRAFA